MIDVHDISEIELELTEHNQVTPPRLVVKLSNSNVNKNAAIALDNLLSLVGQKSPDSQRIEDTNSVVNIVVSQGKTIMKDTNTVPNAVSEIDGIIEAMDNFSLVQLGQMNIVM